MAVGLGGFSPRSARAESKYMFLTVTETKLDFPTGKCSDMLP
jgi:hypothetical protein